MSGPHIGRLVSQTDNTETEKRLSRDEEAGSPCPSSQSDFNHSTDNKNQDALDWDGPNDPNNPHNFSNAKKWLITSSALLLTLLVPINGTSITVAARQINADFGISDASFPNSYWTVTSWSVGGAVFVITCLPLMEDLGGRLGFLIFYSFFLLMIIPQAVAQNFATLVVTRFFSGGCVTILANLSSSTIPDLFSDDKARSLPVGLWILVYLMGNTLGPPLFAGVMQHIGNWRWIFYIQLIIYGALFPYFIFTIKETRSNVILAKKAKALRKHGVLVRTTSQKNQAPFLTRLRKSIVRPPYLLFTEPVLMVCTVWSAFCVGSVYMFTQSVEQVFIGVYNWPSYDTGYVQIAVVIGYLVGWAVSFYGTHLYFGSAKRNDEMPGRPIPEARLYVSILGSFVGLAGGMFVYAWTSYPSITWVAPATGLAMVGFAVQVIISGLADYIVDAYAASNYAASAVSCIAAAENIFAGFLPLATESMYTSLGYNWASCLLGFIGLAISCAPVVVVWKGRQLRERSPFMLSAGQSLFNER